MLKLTFGPFPFSHSWVPILKSYIKIVTNPIIDKLVSALQSWTIPRSTTPHHRISSDANERANVFRLPLFPPVCLKILNFIHRFISPVFLPLKKNLFSACFRLIWFDRCIHNTLCQVDVRSRCVACILIKGTCAIYPCACPMINVIVRVGRWLIFKRVMLEDNQCHPYLHPFFA